MRHINRIFLGLIVSLTLILTSGVAAWRSQRDGRQSPPEGKKIPEALERHPIVDYEATEPGDQSERAKRRAKSATYNDPGGAKTNPSEYVVRASRNDWELGLVSTLPVAQSSAVIVGEVVAAEAHLSEDKANVYSEFSVRVEEVIKNDPAEPISASDVVVAERQGGRVRLPNGRISGYYISGQTPPQVGRRYVLFLGFNKYDASNRKLTAQREMSRHILTGYEFKGGKVFPLDSAGGKNFQEHSGKDATTFLGEVRRACFSSSEVSP